MIKDDVMPMTAFIAPPASPDEAAARISNFGAESFYGLVGLVFQSVDQFRMAMSDCRWNLRADELMNSGRVITYKATAIGPDGTEWRFLLNEVAGHRMDVINAKLTKQGTAVDPEFAKTVEDTLR